MDLTKQNLEIIGELYCIVMIIRSRRIKSVSISELKFGYFHTEGVPGATCMTR